MKLNIGCGGVLPDGWVNADKLGQVGGSQSQYADLRATLPWPSDSFSLIVANHVLSDLDYHELPHAMSELRRVLAPGGVMRILVPDLLAAVRAWERNDSEWFPQDERTEGLDARLCSYVTWYGTVRSVFTLGYLVGLLEQSGFSMVTDIARVATISRGSHFLTGLGAQEVASLDGDRVRQALIVEARK